jgi:hypothetical protein
MATELSRAELDWILALVGTTLYPDMPAPQLRKRIKTLAKLVRMRDAADPNPSSRRRDA